MKNELIDVTWFTSGQEYVGITLEKDPKGNLCSHIKGFNLLKGGTESGDIKLIMEKGNKFPIEAAKKLFNYEEN